MQQDKFIEDFTSQFIDGDSITVDANTDVRQLESWNFMTGMAVLVMIKDEYGIDMSDTDLKKCKNSRRHYGLCVCKEPIMKKAYIMSIQYYLPEAVVEKEAISKAHLEWSIEKIAAKQAFTKGRNCGNIVSSIPIALYHAWRDDKIKPGNKVLLSGFGVGFSAGGLIIKY